MHISELIKFPGTFPHPSLVLQNPPVLPHSTVETRCLRCHTSAKILRLWPRLFRWRSRPPPTTFQHGYRCFLYAAVRQSFVCSVGPMWKKSGIGPRRGPINHPWGWRGERGHITSMAVSRRSDTTCRRVSPPIAVTLSFVIGVAK